jgi:Tfp pilus assembly protein PilX
MLQRQARVIRRPLRHPARGFVLVVALILMGIMALVSTSAIRMALQGDTVAIGLRSINLTSQAAEIGLRWCELQARLAYSSNPASQVVVQGQNGSGTQAPNLWQAINTFQANAVTVPNVVMNAAGLTNFPALPQCLVEENLTVLFNPSDDKTAATRTFVSTVRAFSPDYNRLGANRVGSEVWVQSNLYLSYLSR